MKLIVINSYGPMGSSIVASVIEKYGYINLPIRKTKLEEYVLNLRKINDPFFKNRMREVLDSLSSKRITGGVSVIDRDNNPPLIRIDKNKKKMNLKFYKKEII